MQAGADLADRFDSPSDSIPFHHHYILHT